MSKAACYKSCGLVLISLFLFLGANALADWSMAGANPQRTGYVDEQITGNMSPRWYRPIEPYISQNVQLIAWDGKIYVSTARGLYCLAASDGAILWVYATELPLGHSPAIVDGVAYVTGFDRCLHAVNATTGEGLWKWQSAGFGFHTSPLVVNGKVYVGNRDGNMYCIGAHGTGGQGQLIWSFSTGGAINFSAAYYNGRIYFASMDLHCYALDAESGTLVWKSQKYKYASGFQSFWPAAWAGKNKVVFCCNTPNYRNNASPGSKSVGNRGSYHSIEHTALYSTRPDGYIGPTSTSTPGDWAPGTFTIDMELLVEYHQQYPHRRTVLILDADTGEEYTWLHEGQPAYAPFGLWGTKQSSPRTAPCIGPDNVLYQTSHHRKSAGFGRGQVSGWTLGSRWLSLPHPNKHNAWDEPLAFCLGGDSIYWSLCCDREAGIYRREGSGNWQFVSYNLRNRVPDYDIMWFSVGDQDGTGNRLWGQFGSVSGVYHNHTADQNPPIPHQGKLFYHRSNCVIAWDGAGGGPTSLPLAATVPVTSPYTPPSVPALKARLEAHVQAILDAGYLRIGYFDAGQHRSRPGWGDRMEEYFSHPHETTWALLRALPHLSPVMRSQVRTYIQNWQSSYSMYAYAHIGWDTGAKREHFDVPPEVAADMVGSGPSGSSCSFWSFPPQMFYVLWKYAEEFGNAAGLLSAARNKLTVPAAASNGNLQEFPYINNAYIAGYIGYLNLQDLAGESRNTAVQNELNRLLDLRVDTFRTDIPVSWQSPADNSHINRLGVLWNWEYMTPELGAHLRANIPAQTQLALDKVDYCAPYWFVTHYEGCLQESTIQNLHDYASVFQAHAWVLDEKYEQLVKYLDAPAFKVGDMYYIQNLVSTLEATHIGPMIEPGGGGIYVDPVTVTITMPPAPTADIYYTLDGSEPNDTDTLYTAPFVLSADTTVKAVAYPSAEPSGIATAEFLINTGMANQPPTVDAGENQTIEMPVDTVDLAGTVDDGTLTFPITDITVSWSIVSGSGVVTFGEDQALETTATFSADGVYVLRFTAYEDALSAYDDVTITVNPKPNEAPIVDAGDDQQIILPVNTVTLSGSVVDDNLPDPPNFVSTTWSKLSGPGDVYFDNASDSATTATFSISGTYVLQLDADDSEYAASDTMTVTVYPPLLAGTVVHLKLDDGGGTLAADSSGKGNNGSVGGGALWSSGIDNGALMFDGTNDIVTIPGTWQLDLPKGTWCVWVKTDGNWGVDGRSGGTTVKGSCAVLTRHNATASREGCHVVISDAGIPAFQYKSGVAGEQFTVSAATSVIDNTWHHIATTYDRSMGGPLKIYIDGVPEGSSACGYDWWFNDQDMLVGGSPDDFWEEFAGQIDDIQIYNIVLSDTDIAMLYNNAGSTKKAGDINSSGAVDEVDLGIMAGQWLQTPGSPSADICPPPSGDGQVDILDLAALANDWLN